MTTELFSLLPKNQEAKAVVQHNPDYARDSEIAPYLVFHADRTSKTLGRLACFGKHDRNDIVLPSDENPDRRRALNYRTDHFFFALAPSGELILRDLTSRLTYLAINDGTAEEQRLYSLHGDPRQRVIPRVNRTFTLIFGRTTRFTFSWNPAVFNPGDELRASLRLNAQLRAVPGMSLSNQEGVETGPRYELRSSYTPSVVTESVPRKSIHRYSRLGEGTYGVVWKSVDLSTGSLWAVKEIRPTTRNDSWRMSLKSEVEVVALLRHPNIAHFESFQDFCLGGSFQIIFRLYQGSLEQLILVHDCARPPPVAPVWSERLVKAGLAGLDYLHSQGVIHRDIKPANILFDVEDGDDLPHFYLSDFGLSVTRSDAASSPNPAGTLFYMAPEAGLEQTVTPESDVWSFAVTLGRVLGYWCEKEFSMTSDQWRTRLAAMDYEGRYSEAPAASNPSLNTIERLHVWINRVMSVAQGCRLPDMFGRMLCTAPHRAQPSYLRGVRINQFTSRPSSNRASGQYGSGPAWHLAAYHEHEMSIDFPRGYC